MSNKHNCAERPESCVDSFTHPNPDLISHVSWGWCNSILTMIDNSSRKRGSWKKRDWDVICFKSGKNEKGNTFRGKVYTSFPPLFIQYGEEEQSPGRLSMFKQENMPIISYTGTEQTLWANEGSSGQEETE